jgi:hypothetical protein
MKPKNFFHLTFGFLLLVCFAHSANAITEFGQNPFYNKPLTSESDLKSMLQTQQDDVKKGLIKAGHGDITESFFSQLPDAEVSMMTYDKGQRFPWMFYRKKGKGPVRIDKDVVWEANQSFSVYEFYVDQDNSRYTFIVPPVCGNLALKNIMPVPPKPLAEVAAPTPAPVVVAAPEEKVEKATIPIVVDAGYLHQLDPANHLLLRVGLEHYFNENVSVLGMIGVSPKLDGTESSSAFVADVFANYNWPKMWVGIGLGAWITDGDSDLEHEDSDFDIILNAGHLIYEKPDSYNVSVFVEVRSGLDELDEFDLYGRLGAGLRVHF